MNEKIKFRNELKYLISYRDYLKLKAVIKTTMQLDSNSNLDGYLIRSLYFDDLEDSALYEKNYGVYNRKKFRVRIYNLEKDLIRLERKRKQNQFINKEDFTLDYDTFSSIIGGDVAFLMEAENSVAREFYLDYKLKMLRPKVIVDYVREAYVMKAGNVRITFDKELAASSNLSDFFNRTITRSILPKETMILEVKFDEFLPNIVRGYLSLIDKKPMSLSKYVMCRESIINNEWGYRQA